MKRVVPEIVLAALGLLMALASGCHDLGSEPPDVSPAPSILGVLPDSASFGDTVKILGANFGGTQGSGVVTIGNAVADTVVSWSATQIAVKVPAAASSGSIVVVVGGRVSNTGSFILRNVVAVPQISFAGDILPIFEQFGCSSCHGGTNGLFVGTVAQLLQGGSHGPGIVPGNASASLIIMKTSATPPFGDRMPQGGPYLDNATQQVIKDWINAGAPNN